MSKPTIGQLIDAMYRAREKKKAFQKQADAMSHKQREIEQMLFDALDQQNTRKGEGSLASASINTSIEPIARDWEKTDRFILRHKEIQLLQRRVHVGRFRELLEERPRGVPGLEPYEKKTISLRKLS